MLNTTKNRKVIPSKLMNELALRENSGPISQYEAEERKK
jgi:hypothetical protein